MFACAGTGTVMQGSTFGRPPSRQVAVGPREAGGFRFQHAATEGFSRESISWERSTQDIHTHVVHMTGHTQLLSTVRCDSRKATDGHRSRLSGCGGYWRARTERAVSGLAKTSRPNASASAPEPPDRWPHARLQQPAPAERKSLVRRSAPSPRPPGGGCLCSKPAKGISKRGASAVGHEQREEEQERSPGRRPRGHRGRDCGEEGRWRKGSRRGHARRERPRRGRAPGPPPGSRTPLPGRGRRQVTARGFE